MMSAHPPGTCHCCGTPPSDEIYNRPGLAALSVRIGTFASFRKAMLQSIAREPGMARLTTRQSDDFSIMLMELWAAVGDVLTFYQERVANEAFLRTATQRDSVLRLARMLDYRLRAGLAAETSVAFTADDDKTVRIPIGLRMMSIPEQDQVPQIFETIEAIVADAKLNEVRVYPMPVAVNPFARGTRSAVVLAGPEKLAATEKLLLFDRRTVEEKEISKVETVDEARVITWQPAVQGVLFDPRAAAAARYARTLRFFGLNAPTTIYTLVETPAPPTWHSTPVGGFGVNGSELPLDAKYDDVKVGTRLLLRFAEAGKAPIETAVVVAKSDSTETIGILTDTVTKVTVRRVLRTEAPAVLRSAQPRVFARGLEGACIQFGGGTWSLIDLPAEGEDVTSALAVVARAPGYDLFARSRSGSLLHLVDPITSFPVWEDLGGVITSAPTVASWSATRLDVFARGLDGALWHRWFDAGAWFGWESLGGKLTSAPAAVSWGLNRIDIVARGTDGALWHRWWNGSAWHGWSPLGGADTAGTPAIASTAVNRLDIFARTAEGGLRHRSWNGTQWLPWASLDADIASDPGAVASGTTISIYAVARDGTLASATWNGTTLGSWTPAEGGFEDITDRRGAMLYQLDAEDIAFRQFGYAQRITGGSVTVPLSKLDAIDKRRVIGLSDGTAAAPHRATVTASAQIASIPLGDPDHLQIAFTPDLPAPLETASAILRGNLAEATQGETVHDEILGDGDATVPFQKFALRKKPLTYVATAESLFGESSLRVLVSGELWTEVPTLFGQPSNARVYATRQLDDGTTLVQFGDGVTGARVPSGRGNIVATYRIGVGVAALVAAQLSILLDQPPGLKGALNRAPAEGGADAETLENARAAAPSTVKTFGRAVSLLDFELITTGTAGVVKSNATWVWRGLEKAIYLTVGGANGAPFSLAGIERIRLALGTVRDTGHPLIIGNFVPVPVVLTVNVVVDGTHLRDTVADAVRAVLRDYFSFTNLAFAQPIHLSVISALVQGVTGVLSVDIDTLHFKGFGSWSAAQRALRGATATSNQMHLRIFGARPRPAGPVVDPIASAVFGANVPEVIPAEQAVIVNEASDLNVSVTGGLV